MSVRARGNFRHVAIVRAEETVYRRRRRRQSQVVADQPWKTPTRRRAASEIQRRQITTATASFRLLAVRSLATRFNYASLRPPRQPAIAASHSHGAPRRRAPGMNIQQATTDRPPAAWPPSWRRRSHQPRRRRR